MCSVSVGDRRDLGDGDDHLTVGLNPRRGLHGQGRHRLGYRLKCRRQRRSDLKDPHLDDLPEGIERVGEVLGRRRVGRAHRQAQRPGLLLKLLDAGGAFGHHGQKLCARPSEEGLGQGGLAGRILDTGDRVSQFLELLLRGKAFQIAVAQAQVSQRVGLCRQAAPGVVDAPLHPPEAGLHSLQ